MGGEHGEGKCKLYEDAGNSFITYLWRSDIVLDAASRYTETNAISEVSWVIVVRCISDEGPTQCNA